MNRHLPTITLIRYPWMAAAACAGITDATMHPDTDAQAEAAKNVCRPCTVRDHCLTYAYATDDRYGVLGGLTAEERRVLRRATGVITHGATGYHHGCRCDECRAAHNAKARQYARDKKQAAT